jgi:hypothetical protein
LYSSQPVLLTVSNILGRRTATLVDDYLSEGEHHFRWDIQGNSSGVYFVRLKSPSEVLTRRIAMVK